MSQQPRRRRRGRGGRRRSGASNKQTPQSQQQQEKAPAQDAQQQSSGSRRRRGRRGRERAAEISASPASSEDLVRRPAVERPATLTAPPDGQTLEQVIGDLQSEWGVPQYPQEYRITLKVAEERDRRPVARPPDAPVDEPTPAPVEDGAPRREKAPGMHRQVQSEGAPKRKRGRRRRRRGRGSGGDSAGGGTGEPGTAE
ncbi:MAG: hypothetical protein QOC87_338 [Actinomycetota bacterium]|jgi:hypothetical protein|nr:hypothetical protein [Actinomycetota bacterium]